MRKILLTLSLSVLTILTFAQEIYIGTDARAKFENAITVRSSDHSNLPSYIKFYKGQEVDLDDLMIWLKKNLKLSPQIGFKFIRVDDDQIGHKHYRYRQTYNGIPIEAGTLIAHTKDDKVYSINGNFYQNFTTTTSPSVDESTALEAAKNYVGADQYKWEMPGEEEHLKWEKDDESATYFPEAEIVLVSDDYSFRPESYKAAYKFNIYAHAPLSRSYVYVDIQTGEVIQEAQILHDADEPGTAETVYSGNQTIIADSFAGGYRLRDGSRGLGVRTFDMNEGTSYAGSVDFEDDDNYWDNVNPQLDEYATDAHFGAEMTYDYYMDVHGRNSIDDAGFQLNSYVHYNTDFVNAFWDGERMTYGDGNATYTPLTSMDIAGHEVTHGLTTFSADLIYSAESGALNESFSDIFGTAIEHFATPGDWDWLIGEDIGSEFRSMSNPNANGDPDTYFGDNWASLTGGDSGGVHTNSGVQNFWYYLLNNGGSGTNDNGDAYTVAGQGWEVASSIAFRNLTVYLSESSQFDDARFFAIQSAVDLYGGCSPEVEATTDAWYAVGVGPEYSNDVIADFEALDGETTFCSTPIEVDFTNLSVNGIDFEWDFGDGGTSIVTSPSHVYTDHGTYTVTLIADGGACGADTLELVDYITVDTTLPCIVTMPNDGVGNTQTSCTGTLYDSGGDSDDYGANEDAQITISPTGAATVDLDFVSFNVEAGPGSTCDYDYLEIYDGDDATAPLIDKYCNNNIPSGTISSTGPSITLVFHSDPGVERPGFEVDWNCVMPTVPPAPDFISDVDTTCTGVVNFTDLSTDGPTSWSWDFGDSGTSTDQNPSHTYTTSGLYTVTLTATNAVGSEVETKVDYIYVNLPIAPVVENDTICEDNTASLTASGSGDINWYNVPTGGTPLYTGSTYTTPTLSTSTSYWAEDEVSTPAVNEGPNDNTFGGGSYFTGDQHLIFDVFSPCVLNSVKVYANGSGNRTIQLRDNVGMVIESEVIYIEDGEQTLDLGWNLSVGTNYQLGTEDGSIPDLYRNNSGPSYPYNYSGLVEITNSSAGGSYYYFFYDWELQEPSCYSERSEVEIEVEPETVVNFDPVTSPMCLQDAPQTVSSTTPGGSWSADCGSCINSTTGVFDPNTAGIGTHTITYDIPGACAISNTVEIQVVSCLGVDEENDNGFKIYPNPTKGIVYVTTGGAQSGIVEVTDLVGKKVISTNFTQSQFTLDMTKLQARSTYFVKVTSANGEVIAVKKIIKK